MHIVIAVPVRSNLPLDPHWYTQDFIDYFINLLPKQGFTFSSFFVSFENIPQFLEEIKALHNTKRELCVLNFCDGGEWDGYPGITLLKKWEESQLNSLIPMSGSDSKFVLNSDNKTIMQQHIRKANLTKPLHQALVNFKTRDSIDLESLISKGNLENDWPLFCKLNVGAAALGISPRSIVKNIHELKAQLNRLHKEFPNCDILIQPYLPGPEYTVLVLRDKVYAAVQRDFNNELNMMAEDYLLDPADDIANQIFYYPAPKEVQNLALNAIQAIPGKHHYTRVDIRDDGKGNLYVIDMNDRPALGNPSTVKSMLEYNQLTEAQLLIDIIQTCK